MYRSFAYSRQNDEGTRFTRSFTNGLIRKCCLIPRPLTVYREQKSTISVLKRLKLYGMGCVCGENREIPRRDDDTDTRARRLFSGRRALSCPYRNCRANPETIKTCGTCSRAFSMATLLRFSAK